MKKIFFLMFLLMSYFVFPEGGGEAFETADFIMGIFVLFFVSYIFGQIATKVFLPKAIGYLVAGIFLSPHLFGSFQIPFFAPQGLFPKTGTSIPVKPEIFSLSEIGVMLLLFKSGLETELNILIKYIGKGITTAFSEVLCSFFLGAFVTSIFTHESMFSLKPLFMGAVFTATSVGLTANILSEKRKMQSPEGVIIISSAVIDDILGIIVLAVILGISEAVKSGKPLDVQSIAFIGAKSVGIWLLFTALGIVFSKLFGRGLKKFFRNQTNIVIMSIGFSMLLGSIFEKFGLSAIIGAYIIGLSLSNTDLAFLIQDKIKLLFDVFVPIFFVVSGMYINLASMMSPEVIVFGLVYSCVGILSKLIGAGTPGLFLGFNFWGAIRIGVGMVPRAEVSIIIASMGISRGILNNTQMSAALMLVLITSIFTSVFLNLVLNDKPGEKKSNKSEDDEEMEHEIDLGSADFATLIANSLLAEFEKEDFIVNRIDDIYQIRKEDIFMSLVNNNGKLEFLFNKKDLNVFNIAIKESFVEVLSISENLQKKFAKNMDFSVKETNTKESISALKLSKYVNANLIKTDLKGDNKEDIVKELLESMYTELIIKNKDSVFSEIMERENEFSTGMTDGIALPHAKTMECDGINFAIGIKKEGVEWDSLDGQLSKIIFLIVSPKEKGGPYVLLLSSITTFLNDPDNRQKLIECNSPKDVLNLIEQS